MIRLFGPEMIEKVNRSFIDNRIKELEEMGVKLKRCPFCGSEMNITDPDCIYPTSTPAGYDEEKDEVTYTLWQISCCRGGTGCGAILLGDSKEDCIRRWNIRYN